MELAAPSTSGRQVHAARLQLTLLDPQRLRKLGIVGPDLLDESARRLRGANACPRLATASSLRRSGRYREALRDRPHRPR
jgi:hypothetical protein